MNGRWKRQALCTGTLLAAGLLGSGCVGNWENEESSGGSFSERRVAQLRAQSFESYGDGRLPQEMKPAPQQGTGGSGGGAPAPAAPRAPGDLGTMMGQPVQSQGGGPSWQLGGQGAPAAPSGPAAAPGERAPQQEQERPRRDSGSSPEKG